MKFPAAARCVCAREKERETVFSYFWVIQCSNLRYWTNGSLTGKAITVRACNYSLHGTLWKCAYYKGQWQVLTPEGTIFTNSLKDHDWKDQLHLKKEKRGKRNTTWRKILFKCNTKDENKVEINESRQLRWFQHLVGIPRWDLPGVGGHVQLGGSPGADLGHAQEISWLVWERLCVPLEELREVSEGRSVSASLLHSTADKPTKMDRQIKKL